MLCLFFSGGGGVGCGGVQPDIISACIPGTVLFIQTIQDSKGDVAQLVERPTGALLKRVQFSVAAGDFFFPESAFSAVSLMVSMQPSCAIHLCAC